MAMLTISLNLLTRIQATWQRNTLKKKNAETQSDNFATRERNTRVIIKRTIRRAKCATDVIRAVMQRARIVLTSSSMIPSMRRTLAIVAELKDLIKALIGKWRGLNRGSFPRSPHSSWKTATITTNYFSPLPTTTFRARARTQGRRSLRSMHTRDRDLARSFGIRRILGRIEGLNPPL